MTYLIPLQKVKFLDWSKLKAFADDKISAEIFFGMGQKHCGKREKMLVTSIFSFFHNVFKRLPFQGC